MSSANDTVRITQLSDTHFIEDDAEIEGGFGYDTADAFDAIFDHHAGAHDPDLIVVTGDIADHGRPAQYRRAADAFARFDAPVNVCPGNHDMHAPYTTGMGRPGIGTSRVIEAGEWCFLFADSNEGVKVPHASGRHVDPEDPEDRLHRNGALGDRETSWIRDMCATTNAEHVFVWIHHPPGPPVGLSKDPDYAAEWDVLLPDLPIIRGLGTGHTHVPDQYQVHDRPVYVSPALKNNFDLHAHTFLPPGYRTYEFAPDGTIESQSHLVDDARWPRNPMGRLVIALFNGDIDWDQFNAIVARKRAERANS